MLFRSTVIVWKFKRQIFRRSGVTTADNDQQEQNRKGHIHARQILAQDEESNEHIYHEVDDINQEYSCAQYNVLNENSKKQINGFEYDHWKVLDRTSANI